MQLAIASCDDAIRNKPQVAPPRLLRTMLSLALTPHDEHESENTLSSFCQELESLESWADEDVYHLQALGQIVGDRQPFAIAYRAGNLCGILSRYGNLMAKAAYAYWNSRGLVPVPNVSNRSRVRLAILNEQIRRHSVWDIILKGIVKNINRSQFELVLYHTGSHIDEETRWASSVADKFVQGPKGHAEWLMQIRADAPDVLYLPEIGMDPLTCKLAALRLAPLQVVSWGHPVTTGLPEMDLYFSGELLEASSADSHYRENWFASQEPGACTEPYADQYCRCHLRCCRR